MRKTDANKSSGPSETAVRGLAQLDPLLQHRSRLGACVLLRGVDALAFSRLRDLLNETDGNLGASLRKLEDAGYVTVRKEFVDRKPTSWYALAPRGLKAVREHLAALQMIIDHSGKNGG
jgi:DNA-binding MarR family transcriptional regulator